MPIGSTKKEFRFWEDYYDSPRTEYAHWDNVYNNVILEAVKQSGFNLDCWRSDRHCEPGDIDDDIIEHLYNDYIAIFDITCQNPNVYWEAGYAEALGKPVIYTCEESFFNKRPFDIRHKQTIKWNRNNLDEAVAELKSTIRATLPDAAKMEDDEGETK